MVVKKETCTVCKGNKIVQIQNDSKSAENRTCPGCNGNGYQVKIVHLMR